MSSIHYKFRAELDYKTLQFDGLHIRGEQLVREICAKENLKWELFDLQLQNAHTKKMYADDELIPRNSSIIVQRSPRKDAAKVQKVQAGVNSGMVNQPDATSSSLDPSTHIASAEFENMDEAERLNHIRDQSTRAYDPANYRRRPQQGIMTGPPPPTYTCNRCYQPGHWFKNCPMISTKRTTGIPSQELMETTADDPAAMLHPSGKYVVPIMHWKARQDTLSKKNEDGSSSPAQVDRKVPPELLCPLCQSLFKEAIVTSCCGNSYCAECIEQRIIDPENRKCPGADCGKDVSITSIIPNKTLRDAASAWLSANAPGAPSVTQEPEQIRIRIGLKAPPSTNSNPQLLSSGISPGGSLVPQSTENVTPIIAPVVSVPANTSAPPPPNIVNPAIPGLSSNVSATTLIQDVSLPPPQIRHELPPGIPGAITPFPQSTIGVPGLSGTVLPHPQTLPLSYGMPVFTPGFPPAASSAPRSSVLSGIDEWNAFLQKKDSKRDQRGKDRTRRKDRHSSRSRRRRESSSSSSSTLSSFSGDEDRYRRNRREKDSKRRRSVEKERQRRSDEHRRNRDRDRERDRERDHRDTKSSGRSRDVKSSSSSSNRRDRDETRRRDRKREDDRRKTREEDKRDPGEEKERTPKDVESKDEDEIDGIIAEYGNAQTQRVDGSPQNIDETDDPLKDDESSTPQQEESPSPEQKESHREEEEDPAADEEPVDEEDDTISREKSQDPINHALETSEAEVAETKEEGMIPIEDEEEMENKKDENGRGNDALRREKESQSSAINSADDDDDDGGGKKLKKHKKSKKSKKHHRKEEDEEEDEERKRKKHKKHKKEKKAKKERKNEHSDYEEERKERRKEKPVEKAHDISDSSDRKDEKKERKNDEYDNADRKSKSKVPVRKYEEDDDRKERKKERERQNEEEQDKKKERKRDRDADAYDSDAPKIKVKREEPRKEDRQDPEREKDRKRGDYEKDKERRKENDRNERDRKRDKEKEKERVKEKEREQESEKERKEKMKVEAKPIEKPRRSVHERLQKAENVNSSATTSSRTAPVPGRKPVSFSLSSNKAASTLRVRQYSSSSSTKEQEDDEISKKSRRRKEETDIETSGEKHKKSSRLISSSGQSASKHKNIKIKFDL